MILLFQEITKDHTQHKHPIQRGCAETAEIVSNKLPVVVQANSFFLIGLEQRQAAVFAEFGKRASSLWDLGASSFIEVWQRCTITLLSPVGFVGNVEGGA